MIRMVKMRFLDGRKYFVQKEIGRIIGVSRHVIGREMAGIS